MKYHLWPLVYLKDYFVLFYIMNNYSETYIFYFMKKYSKCAGGVKTNAYEDYSGKH